MIFDEQKIDDLIAQCRLDEASASLALSSAPRTLRAAVAAIAGDDRTLATCADPGLLACRTLADVEAHHLALGVLPGAEEQLAVAAVLAWSSDEAGCEAALHAARDLAIAQRRFHLAVAACERLAHHALLFGSVEPALRAIGEAVALAQTHRLSNWALRCVAVMAGLALDTGDLDRAGLLLAQGRAASRSSEEVALFAAAGAQLAVELGDDDALRGWTSPGALDVALRSDSRVSVANATVAVLIAAGGATPGLPIATALRRALFSQSTVDAVELFASAARYGDAGHAEFAVEAFASAIAPNRPYLHAHQLLARAHALLKTGERGSWVDSAGDAARAFSAMGLRRWTNEAMRLLVAHEPQLDRRGRGRSSGLTEREIQVAHLIRRGARNREVAEALQISEHTVERHVSSILGRLGLRSRWQIGDSERANGD